MINEILDHIYREAAVLDYNVNQRNLILEYLSVLNSFFIITSNFPRELVIVTDSALVPWQQIKALRIHIIAYISHELSSGRGQS